MCVLEFMILVCSLLLHYVKITNYFQPELLPSYQQCTESYSISIWLHVFSFYVNHWLCNVGDTTLPADQSYTYLNVDDAKDLRYRDRKVQFL